MAKKKQRELLMLLDGNAIIHRAFHGVPPLTMDDGTIVNAVYGFTSTLMNVLEKFQPTHVIASFDLPGGTFRNDMYPEYKANRKALDPDLKPQFELTKEVVRAFNISIVERSGVEADDVIGTLSVQGESEGVDVVIVTGDKDTFQLVTDKVSVFTMSRGISDMKLYDAAAVIDKMGVTPEQIVDYKGLCGDSSDNIPGVKGVGAKTAEKLLTDWQDLDGVYAHIDETKGALNKRLHEHKDLAFLSKELGRIKLDVDVQLDLEGASVENIDWSGARKAFHKFSFNSLMKRLGERGIVEGALDEGGDAVAKSVVIDTFTSVTGSDVQAFFHGLPTSEIISLTIDGDREVLRGVAISSSAANGYVPYNSDTQEAVTNFLASMQNRMRFFDAKNALHIFAAHGLTVEGVAEDVLLKSYVARSGKKLVFDDLVFEATGRITKKSDDKNQMTLDLQNPEDAQRAFVQAASDLTALNIFIDKEIEGIVASQEGKTILDILHEQEMPLIRVLFDMERAGVSVDQSVFGAISEEMQKEIVTLEKGIYEDAGSEFNINSPKQLQVVLFEDMKIDSSHIKKTKTGYSTASSELDKMREGNPIIEKIERYRELYKLKSTYSDVLPTLADAESRIHTTYNQTITPTGRLSSIDPNLQNIPARTETGRRLRDGFVAPEGKKLVSADYSQIELRCVAHVAKDKRMIEAFENGVDIHTYTAATVLGKDVKDIDYDERRSAKELNFGLIYGMGAFSFAKTAHISVEEATEFIDAYFAQFAGVKAYMDDIKKSGSENGFVETESGRRKATPELQSSNFQLRAAGERAAINMPIQGLAAEIMKLAMIAVDEYLKDQYESEEAMMILQVHDEVILEVADEHVADVQKEIDAIMQSVYDLSVPLVVDTAVGQNWGEL